MPNFVAMSFEGALAPSFRLRCLADDHQPPDGWGLGYYPGDEPFACLVKEASPPHNSLRGQLVRAGQGIESSIFLLHVRTATWGRVAEVNTQPFQRSFRGRDWLLGHAGSLRQRLDLGLNPRFVPIGSTDSEQIFCWLLGRIAQTEAASLGDLDAAVLRAWLAELAGFGNLTLALTDGRDLALYGDPHSQGAVWLWRMVPPGGDLVFGDDDVEVDLVRRGPKSRKGVVAATTPLGPAGWEVVPPGQLVIVRQGEVRSIARPDIEGEEETMPSGPLKATAFMFPTRKQKTRYDVSHRTVYRYARPVERSTHLLRLRPAHDRWQALLDHRLTLSVDGRQREYEDVFGNVVRRLEVEDPYTELAIEASSRVEVLDVDPFDFRPAQRLRSTIPLVWMPWQRQILQPYLLPVELPDTQLQELTDYAMSFVERSDYDLLETLCGINQSIFSEYDYKPGATTLATTPFDVYVHRRGVCQDFANLFICLARLLGVPARYVCGYVYTGTQSPNRSLSDASHAWAQVYLPEAGWKGFDPTNGTLTQVDHVRASHGRNWVDATPTSGTIFVGGGTETLEVQVRVERIE